MYLVVAFVFRIGDLDLGGTCTTTLFSCFNFGKTFGEPIALMLMDKFSWTSINFFALLFEIIFLISTFKYFKLLEMLPIEKLSPNYKGDDNTLELKLLKDEEE